jgi:hypothetical protein
MKSDEKMSDEEAYSCENVVECVEDTCLKYQKYVRHGHENPAMGCPRVHFRTGWIYKLKSASNAIPYIGSTQRINCRKVEHEQNPTAGSRQVTRYKDWTMEIVEKVEGKMSRSDFNQFLEKKEMEQIQALKGKCYNIRCGKSTYRAWLARQFYDKRMYMREYNRSFRGKSRKHVYRANGGKH